MMSLETVVNWKISVKMLKSMCVNVRMSVWLCVTISSSILGSILVCLCLHICGLTLVYEITRNVSLY